MKLFGVLLHDQYGSGQAYTQEVKGDNLQEAITAAIEELRETVSIDSEDFDMKHVDMYHSTSKTGVELASYNFPPKK